MSYAPSTIRSVQYSSGSVAVADGFEGTKTVTFGTTLTDAGKAIMIQTRFGGNTNGMEETNEFSLDAGWTITNTTTASIVVSTNQDNGAGSIKYSFYVLEYY
jgi:hypothetical protein